MTYFPGICTWGLSASRPKYWGNLVGQYTWQGSAACLGINLSNQVEWSNNEAHESSQFSLEVKPTLLRSVHFSLGFQDLSDTKGGATRRTEREKSTRYPNFLTILFFCFVHFETMRRHARLSTMYKMCHGLLDGDWGDYLKTSKERRTRGSHDFKFIVPKGHKDIFRFSFFPRTITEWKQK